MAAFVRLCEARHARIHEDAASASTVTSGELPRPSQPAFDNWVRAGPTLPGAVDEGDSWFFEPIRPA